MRVRNRAASTVASDGPGWPRQRPGFVLSAAGANKKTGAKPGRPADRETQAARHPGAYHQRAVAGVVQTAESGLS